MIQQQQHQQRQSPLSVTVYVNSSIPLCTATINLVWWIDWTVLKGLKTHKKTDFDNLKMHMIRLARFARVAVWVNKNMLISNAYMPKNIFLCVCLCKASDNDRSRSSNSSSHNIFRSCIGWRNGWIKSNLPKSCDNICFAHFIYS